MCNVVFHIANINVCVWSGSKSLVFIKTREDTTSGIGSTSCASLSSHIRGSHVAAKKPFCFHFALVRWDPELILTFTKMRETCLNKERALNCHRSSVNLLRDASCQFLSFWPKQLKTTTMINCSLNYRSISADSTQIRLIMISESLRPLILFSAVCLWSRSMLHPHVWQ